MVSWHCHINKIHFEANEASITLRARHKYIALVNLAIHFTSTRRKFHCCMYEKYVCKCLFYDQGVEVIDAIMTPSWIMKVTEGCRGRDEKLLEDDQLQ